MEFFNNDEYVFDAINDSEDKPIVVTVFHARTMQMVGTAFLDRAVHAFRVYSPQIGEIRTTGGEAANEYLNETARAIACYTLGYCNIRA